MAQSVRTLTETKTGVAVLQLAGLTAGYEGAAAIRGIDLVVEPGTVVALLGANGAGKTTTLRAAAGLIKPMAGTISIRGEDVTKLRPSKRAARGLCLIPEGRGIYPNLTVRENLRLQSPPWRSSTGQEDRAFTIFPALKAHLSATAGRMSGGQQQMLALARAWLSDPAVVLLDEVSMGLAPIVVDEIFTALRLLASTGTSLLLVEQYVSRALEVADSVYVLDQGSLAYGGSRDGIDQERLTSGYFGS